LEQIVDEVTAMKMELAWLRITPVVDAIHNARSTSFHRFAIDVDHYNQIADEVMHNAGAHVIDLHALCAPLVPDALVDHIHYNESTRKKQAKSIADDLTTWWGSR